jgi:hypothetical protein
MVVADEDAQIRSAREPLPDPRVVLATDLAVVDFRLGRIHRERHLHLTCRHAQLRVPRPEHPLELQIADMARVVISGNDDDPWTGKRVQLLLGQRVPVGVALIGDVAGDHDEIRLRLVDLVDRGAQQ